MKQHPPQMLINHKKTIKIKMQKLLGIIIIIIITSKQKIIILTIQKVNKINNNNKVKENKLKINRPRKSNSLTNTYTSV
eukprot:UN04554